MCRSGVGVYSADAGTESESKSSDSVHLCKKPLSTKTADRHAHARSFQHARDDRIVDFYYPILSCFCKRISVSNPNPVLVEIILSVSEKYPKVYCDAHYTFLCCVYFALLGKLSTGAILPLAKHNWLK